MLLDYLADHLSPEQLQAYVLEREPLGDSIKSFLWGIKLNHEDFLAVAAAIEAQGHAALTPDSQKRLQSRLSPETYSLLEDLQTPALRAVQSFALRCSLDQDTVQQLIQLRRSSPDVDSPAFREGVATILTDSAVSEKFLNDRFIKESPMIVPRLRQ